MPRTLLTATMLTLARSAMGFGTRFGPAVRLRPAVHLSSHALHRRAPVVTAAVSEETDAADEKVAITLPNNDNSEQLLRIRHSTAHVMAMAVQKLFKGTKVSIGPWIEKGFYYDFVRTAPALNARAFRRPFDRC